MATLILTWLCVAVSMSSVSVSGLSLERSAYEQKYLPLTQPEVLAQYKEYGYSVAEDQPFAWNDEIAVNQLGIGLSLAVVNENVVLNVSSSGIENVLKIGCHKITPAFRTLVQKLKQDPNTRLSSTIYTQEQDVYLSPGLGKLITFVNLVDKTSDMKSYVDFINAEIQRKSAIKVPIPFFQSEGLSPQQLGGEYLVNIFEYENEWAKPWSLMAEPASFFSLNKTEQVQFMMTEGFYDLVEKNNYVLVRIPLPGGKRSLVLVKSNIHYVQLLKSGKTPEDWARLINKLWNDFVGVAKGVESGEWTRKYVNVQIPTIKSVVGSSVIQRLKNMGLNKTLCPSPDMTLASPTNFMEQFGQLNLIEFNTDKLSLASVTGTKNIGSNRQEAERHSIRRRSPEDVQDTSSSSVDANDARTSTQIPVGEPVDAFMAVFDQPFFWSLNDADIGPLMTGGILFPSTSTGADGNLPSDYMKQFLLCSNEI